jgi:hypothetical protein
MRRSNFVKSYQYRSFLRRLTAQQIAEDRENQQLQIRLLLAFVSPGPHPATAVVHNRSDIAWPARLRMPVFEIGVEK